MKRAIQEAVAAIHNSRRVALASHVNPDGDALGCILALMHALKHLELEAVPLSHDGVPMIYSWMPGADSILSDTPRRDFDLSIVCDAGRLDRVGRVRPAVESAPIIIDVDHHVSEGPFGSIRLLNRKAAATAEIVYQLICALDIPISFAIAQCLLTGLITDTGSFRFMNVTPQTFMLSARLMRSGASPSLIADMVFEQRSIASLKLLGRALNSLQVSEDGLISWAHITADDFLDLHADDAETEGIVNQVRAVRGALVGLLFREIPGRQVRVSLRSREGFDVNAVAAQFGGGGHQLAAGCSVNGPLNSAEQLVLSEVRRCMA
ncbi:MAG: bifunctional oligoribonuclease/PAP phosphatase NrnA [Armatimonadetes bacterium]|nr:bifunctional oligoribonuclease/PAP phosphatase NrnA [Armatimonadota bacterium]